MTNFGKWLLGGCVVILAMLVYIAVESLPTWVFIGIGAVGGLVLAVFIWARLHAIITAAQLRKAEARKAQAEADQAAAIAAQQRARAKQEEAIAQQKWAEAAALWNQTRLIPQQAIGMMLEHPGQAALNQVWTFSQVAGPRKVENYLLESEEVEADKPVLPVAEDFRRVKGQVGPNNYLLGYYLDEAFRSRPLWVSLDAVIAMAVPGPQGMGKTTLLRLLALMAAMQGGELHVCDYFGDVAREMRPYFPHCYHKAADVERYANQVLFPEMERRYTLYEETDGQAILPPLIVEMDEWGAFKDDCPIMGAAMKNAFTIWRKLNLRFVVSSVQLNAADLGVSKGNVSTVALFTGNADIALTWGVKGKQATEQLRKLYTSGPGYCVVTSQTLQQYALLIAVPNITPEVFRQVLLEYRPDILRRRQTPAWESREYSPGQETAGTGLHLLPKVIPPAPTAQKAWILTPGERQFIADRYRTGALRTEIRDKLREQRTDGFGNRHWDELKEICDGIDAEMGKDHQA